jgi:microcystin-dependent protein
MSDPFVGEIRMFAGNFAPRNFAFCDGQLVAISQNNALFSLFGTIYGGDGRTTFGLPDLRGRVPLHMGTGPGLSPRPIGQKGGSETVALSAANLPAHGHSLSASTSPATESRPEGNVPAGDTAVDVYQDSAGATHLSSTSATAATTGGGTAHPNVQPFLCISYIVSLFGVYPSRN